MRKPKVVLVAGISVALVLSSLMFVFMNKTYAYFTDQRSVTNYANTGAVNVTVEENIANGVKKDVKVKNSGSVRSFVRVLVTRPSVPGLEYTYAPEYPAGWVQGGEYLYYDGVLEPNEEAVLYDEISVAVKSRNGNDFIGSTAVNNYGDVIIYAEAVQADNILSDAALPENAGADEAMEAFQLLKNGRNNK